MLLRHARAPIPPGPGIAQQYCVRQEIDYTETSLLRSYGIVIAYLNRVGLAARNPFECPLGRLRRR